MDFNPETKAFHGESFVFNSFNSFNSLNFFNSLNSFNSFNSFVTVPTEQICMRRPTKKSGRAGNYSNGEKRRVRESQIRCKKEGEMRSGSDVSGTDRFSSSK